MSSLPQFAVVQGVAHTALVVTTYLVLLGQGGVHGILAFPRLPKASPAQVAVTREEVPLSRERSLG